MKELEFLSLKIHLIYRILLFGFLGVTVYQYNPDFIPLEVSFAVLVLGAGVLSFIAYWSFKKINLILSHSLGLVVDCVGYGIYFFLCHYAQTQFHTQGNVIVLPIAMLMSMFYFLTLTWYFPVIFGLVAAALNGVMLYLVMPGKIEQPLTSVVGLMIGNSSHAGQYAISILLITVVTFFIAFFNEIIRYHLKPLEFKSLDAITSFNQTSDDEQSSVWVLGIHIRNISVFSRMDAMLQRKLIGEFKTFISGLYFPEKIELKRHSSDFYSLTFSRGKFDLYNAQSFKDHVFQIMDKVKQLGDINSNSIFRIIKLSWILEYGNDPFATKEVEAMIKGPELSGYQFVLGKRAAALVQVDAKLENKIVNLNGKNENLLGYKFL